MGGLIVDWDFKVFVGGGDIRGIEFLIVFCSWLILFLTVKGNSVGCWRDSDLVLFCGLSESGCLCRLLIFGELLLWRFGSGL